MFTFSSKPLPIFKVVIEGFKLFSHTFSKIWYWSLLFHFINSLPNIMLFLRGAPASQRVPFGYLLFYLVIFIIQVYGTIFLMHRIYAISASQLPTLNSFNAAKEKILTATVASAILIAIIIANVVVFGFIAKSLNLSGGLAFLLMIPPLVFFSILLLLYLPLILFANQPATEALKQSALLVWGNWWETLLVPVVPGMISLLLIVFAFLIQSPNSFGLILSMLVISTLIAPLTYSLILVQYNNLRLLKNQQAF